MRIAASPCFLRSDSRIPPTRRVDRLSVRGFIRYGCRPTLACCSLLNRALWLVHAYLRCSLPAPQDAYTRVARLTNSCREDRQERAALPCKSLVMGPSCRVGHSAMRRSVSQKGCRAFVPSHHRPGTPPPVPVCAKHRCWMV
jgi:hypothetical protein